VSLRFYLDESESIAADDPAVCVGGYVGEGKKWMQFINQWNGGLDKAPKPVQVFHAADYDKGRKSNWGSYSGWTPNEREDFINRLIRIVHSYKFKDIGCVIHRSTFKQVATGKRSGKHGSLFVVAAKVALINVSAWALRKNHEYAPSFFVEAGSQYANPIREALEQLKATEHPEFRKFFSRSALAEDPKSREFPQTQPADFLAYYCSKWASRFSGFDPSEETIDDFRSRTGATMPVELQRLLKPKNGITYHTPGSLDLLLTSLETNRSLAEIDSIVNDD
jgi:hypothetical protein